MYHNQNPKMCTALRHNEAQRACLPPPPSTCKQDQEVKATLNSSAGLMIQPISIAAVLTYLQCANRIPTIFNGNQPYRGTRSFASSHTMGRIDYWTV